VGCRFGAREVHRLEPGLPPHLDVRDESARIADGNQVALRLETGHHPAASGNCDVVAHPMAGTPGPAPRRVPCVLRRTTAALALAPCQVHPANTYASADLRRRVAGATDEQSAADAAPLGLADARDLERREQPRR